MELDFNLTVAASFSLSHSQMDRGCIGLMPYESTGSQSLIIIINDVVFSNLVQKIKSLAEFRRGGANADESRGGSAIRYAC